MAKAKKAKALAAAWSAYKEEMIRGSITPKELEGQRMAYFTGCSTVLFLLNQLSHPLIPEEAAAQIIAELNDEALEFVKTLTDVSRN
jgi:hypothetical protein